jgi:hypothetical protein
MAKKKLVVSLGPIKKQIKAAETKLRGFKGKVSVKDRKQIDLDIKNLDAALIALTKVCHGIMTHGFAPSDDEE